MAASVKASFLTGQQTEVLEDLLGEYELFMYINGNTANEHQIDHCVSLFDKMPKLSILAFTEHNKSQVRMSKKC